MGRPLPAKREPEAEPSSVSVTIPGQPVAKKTSQRIAKRRRGGRPFILSSDAHRRWRDGNLPGLKLFWHSRVGRAWGSREEPVQVRAVFYLGPGQRPDLDNLYTAILDLLQAAGVISNDYWVMTPHPETRRVRDGSHPRAEITIWRRPDHRWEF